MMLKSKKAIFLKIWNAITNKWQDLKFRFLVQSLLFFLVVWNFFEDNILRVGSLAYLMILYSVHLFKNRDTTKNWLKRFLDSSSNVFLYGFVLIYLITFLKLPEFTLLTMILVIFFVISMWVTQGLVYLFDSKGDLIPLVFSYIQFAFSTILLFALLFGVTSAISEKNGLSGDVSDPLTFEELLYFSSSTFFSAGYGDIFPKGNINRLFSQIEVFIGAVIHIIVIGYLVSKRKKKS